MSKIKVSDSGIIQEAKGDRLARWKKHVENYEKANPVKYAQKRATEYLDENAGSPTFGKMIPKKDELAEPPPSFK